MIFVDAALDKRSPRVSIGMPVRNCQDTLQPALQSLLAQTYTSWELLLIDDGSQDETVQIARQFADPRIKISSDGQWLGISARLNQAIAAARGEYFARMDGDDVAYPDRFELQVAYMDTHEDVDLVGSAAMVFDSNGKPLGRRGCPERHEEICRRPIAGFRMIHPTFLGRLDWFKAHYYDHRAHSAEDQELLLRAHKRSRFANFSDILLGYREPSLALRRNLGRRWSFAVSALRYVQSEGDSYLSLSPMLLKQLVSSALDIVAIGTGLNYRLLHHRAGPASAEEILAWRRVWNSVQAQTSPAGSAPHGP
ncbi:MAG: glycosyltransferase family A protein [bacterium]|nr:glycosyltransferase family A protein [bacterium]